MNNTTATRRRRFVCVPVLPSPPGPEPWSPPPPADLTIRHRQVSGRHAAGDYLTDVVINGHHIHGPSMKSAPLREFIARLPDWTVAVGFSSSLEAIQV